MACQCCAVFFLAILLNLLLTGFVAAQSEKIRPVNVATLKSWLEQSPQTVLIDVGSLLVCLDAKIPGAVCLPCDQGKDTAFFSTLDRKSKIVFYSAETTVNTQCALISKVRSAGFDNTYVLEGGLAAWRKAENPIVAEKRIPRIPQIAVNPENLSNWKNKAHNPFIVDIRSPEAFAADRLDGAVNFPLTRLHVQYAEIPLDRTLLIVDEDGTASFLAASYLARKGFDNASRLKGGMAEYRRGTR